MRQLNTLRRQLRSVNTNIRAIGLDINYMKEMMDHPALSSEVKIAYEKDLVNKSRALETLAQRKNDLENEINKITKNDVDDTLGKSNKHDGPL